MVHKILSPTDVSVLILPQNTSHRLVNSTISRDIIRSLENSLKSLIHGYGSLNNENIMLVVTNMMSIVGKYQKLTGSEKKEVVIILVTNAINDSDELDEQLKDILRMTMSTVIPTSIDIMVSISKGEYKFKYLPKIVTWIKQLKCC
jgi:hypothetical protein